MWNPQTGKVTCSTDYAFFCGYCSFFLLCLFTEKFDSCCLCVDDALKVATSLKHHIQNLQDTWINHSWNGKVLLHQKTNTRRSWSPWRCSRYAGEVDKGPFASLQDGREHAKLSPLSPRTEIFPGSQNSKPTGCALSRYDALVGRGFGHIWSSDTSCPWTSFILESPTCNSCLAETRELQTRQALLFSSIIKCRDFPLKCTSCDVNIHCTWNPKGLSPADTTYCREGSRIVTKYFTQVGCYVMFSAINE